MLSWMSFRWLRCCLHCHTPSRSWGCWAESYSSYSMACWGAGQLISSVFSMWSTEPGRRGRRSTLGTMSFRYTNSFSAEFAYIVDVLVQLYDLLVFVALWTLCYGMEWFEVLDGLLGKHWRNVGLTFNCTFLLFGSVIQLIACARYECSFICSSCN